MIRQIIREEVQRALGSPREEPKIANIKEMDIFSNLIIPFDMPRKRSAIGVRTSAARRMATRASRGQSSRTLENPPQSQAHLKSDQLRHRVQRASETPQQSQTRKEADRLRHFRLPASTWADMLNAAFHYNPALNYEQFTFLQIGHMDKQCLHCTAFKSSQNSARWGSPHSAEFMQRVRHYNNAFQMTYFGCGGRVVLPGYMPTFKVQGQVYHRIGSVLPPLNSDSRQLQPVFLQVFFIGDSSVEVATRHRNCPITKPHIVSILQDMLHRHNPYVHLFKASIEKMPSPDYKLVIKADKAPPGHHIRTFNAPTIIEVAIVIVQENCDRRDIVLSKRGSGVQRINEFHRSYDALQYSLSFWNGQDGYHFHIPQLIDGVRSAHKTVSCMYFYASLLMIRSRNPGITNWLLAFGDLTHQILVDIYAKVESEMLHYISALQAQLRATECIILLDAIRTDRSHALIGRQVIFPSSFVGSPRHMHEYAQDCMAYVRKYGRPDIFITFTCNPEWPEIKLMQFPTQGAFVRHDLVARIFQLKVTKLIDFITKGDVFGKPQCWCYTIEWQKRGLPHAHILLWLKEKIRPNQIDSIICAEIPNEEVDALLFRTVTKNMIHGPCGHGYPNPGCMKRGRCQKKYPRLLLAETQTDRDGYPLYRRRRPEEGGFSFVKRVRVFTIENGVQVVRMTNVTIDNRRHPMVQHLSVHLENVQPVYFTSANASLQAHRPPKTTLTEFFALCQRDNFAKTLLYVEVPVYYIWSATKSWQPRKQGTRIADQVAFASDAIGRVYTVHPNFEECFYLRMLLHSVRGPTSFAALRTINGVLCKTYKEACLHLGLLENDHQWHHCIQKAVLSESPLKIRELFAIMLTCCHPTNPQDIWAQFKEPMSADILILARQQANDGLLQLTYELSNQALILLEQNVLLMTGFHLTKFGMRSPQRNVTHRTSDEISRETSYDLSRLLQFVASSEPKLANVPEQRRLTKEILTHCYFHNFCFNLEVASVDAINAQLLKEIPGQSILYTSVDSTIDAEDCLEYTAEFLNILEPSGMPPHHLELRVGVPIILLRNIDAPRLCNGTRLCVKRLWPHVVEATILTGCFQKEDVFIPRIPLIHDDKHSPLHFKRLQSPIRVSFAMSINKAQGQSLKIGGIDLEQPFFAWTI
ncbi:hypothetical protein LAZ67_7002235, partial [Cordylochernes scorpioides]